MQGVALLHSGSSIAWVEGPRRLLHGHAHGTGHTALGWSIRPSPALLSPIAYTLNGRIGPLGLPFALHWLMKLLSGVVVVTFGLSLIGLAVTIFARPRLAERFLNSFASSARAHYAEQVLRLLVGASMVVFSPEMWQPDLFRIVGWLIVVTAIGLLCIPWQWHHRFAKWVVPPVIRHMKIYALGVFAFGVFLLYSVFSAEPYGDKARTFVTVVSATYSMSTASVSITPMSRLKDRFASFRRTGRSGSRWRTTAMTWRIICRSWRGSISQKTTTSEPTRVAGGAPISVQSP